MKLSKRHRGDPSDAPATMTMHARREFRFLDDRGRHRAPRVIAMMDPWTQKFLGVHFE